MTSSLLAQRVVFKRVVLVACVNLSGGRFVMSNKISSTLRREMDRNEVQERDAKASKRLILINKC